MALKYRLDPATTYTSLAMLDDGTGGDAVAGDGIYSATIPGQAASGLVAFHVQASDNLTASSTFPNDAPTRECLVRFGETQPAGNFPVYRIWMTKATLTTWANRNKLNNAPLDITFVLGNRRVIYNTQALYAGSPYIAPGYQGPNAGVCGYSITFPDDDLFLGSTDLVLDWPGGHGNENTAMQEQMAYYIAERMDLPTCFRQIIRLHVNGVTDTQRGSVFEAVNQPASDFVKVWSPILSSGDFYKVDRAFEFDDNGSLVADPMPTLQVFTNAAGLKKESRYRWNWSKRATDEVNDHTNIFQLVDALNATGPEPYTSQAQAIVDIDEWMGIFAVEHIINNFDSYGHDIGKNMYAYKPDGGKWQLYLFDLDWLMLAAPNGPGNYTASSGPLFTGNDTIITRMYAFPPFRRAYLQAVQAAVDGPLASTNCNPVMDAKYNSLVANGVQFCDGQVLTAPTLVKTWFSQRRTYLLSQLAPVNAPFTLSGPATFTASSNLVTLTGTAPIGLKTIEINGISRPITWTTPTNWVIRIPIRAATNELAIQGVDRKGQPIATATNHVSVVYAAASIPTPGSIVINEIMYNPLVDGAEYVELLNKSSTATYDLTGWRLDGVDYVFPEGSYILPRSYLVLAKDRRTAGIAYGKGLLVFDTYPGKLPGSSLTLELVMPGADGQPDVTLDKVRYQSTEPWPWQADGFGPSLQLIDAAQDNSRVSNWSAGTPSWRFFSYTGPVSGSRLSLSLEGGVGEVYIDDISVNLGRVAATGTNMVVDGGFETPLSPGGSGPWFYVGDGVTNSAPSSAVHHTGNSSLHLTFNSPGQGASLYQDLLPLTNNAIYTLSYWYLPTTLGQSLIATIGPSFQTANVLSYPSYTPGAANSIAGTVVPYPSIWLNEVQAENLSGITDNQGQRDPWVELYNAGATSVDLAGLQLSDDYATPGQWTFPAGSVIAPGEFKLIFADAEPAQSTPSEPHTNFRLPPGFGSIVLSRPSGQGSEIIDYLNYQDLGAGRSYGAVPDGQPFDRRSMYYVTPREPNKGTPAPVTVFINEWMASNTGTLGNPATVPPQFDDWFELYNPGTSAVDLTGFSLTDTLTNQTQYVIPSGYAIPPQGFLLVWADNQPSRNKPGQADLHVNFQLSKSGEAIGLFAPDGGLVDQVAFGPQSNDISQGRFPDGADHIFLMPHPTPRGANTIPVLNSSPLLIPIGNKTVHRGQVVSFVAQATDAEAPPQLLSFSLDPGAPAGATIDARSGRFTWPTAGISAPATVLTTIHVSDDGTPPLASSETITLQVIAPPTLALLTQSPGHLTLGWGAIPGQVYRIEFTDDLGVPNWQALGGDLVTSTQTLTFDLDTSATPARFFRIRAVE